MTPAPRAGHRPGGRCACSSRRLGFRGSPARARARASGATTVHGLARHPPARDVGAPLVAPRGDVRDAAGVARADGSGRARRGRAPRRGRRAPARGGGSARRVRRERRGHARTCSPPCARQRRGAAPPRSSARATSTATSPAADLPITEDAPLRPLTVYGASKAAAEVAALQWERAYGLDVVVARPFNHTGPGQLPAFVCAAFASQVAAIERGRQPPVLRSATSIRCATSPTCATSPRGYVALLERGRGGRGVQSLHRRGRQHRRDHRACCAASRASRCGRGSRSGAAAGPHDVARIVGQPRAGHGATRAGRPRIPLVGHARPPCSTTGAHGSRRA